jgi:hypothetical protein
MSLRKVSVSKQLMILVSVCGLAITAVAACSLVIMHNTTASIAKLNESVRVNGPIYQSIIQGKDAVADVLPPPKYIIESYLAACELSEAADEAQRGALIKDLEKLKAEYQDRQEYWLKQLAEGPLKTAMVETAHKPAVKFYSCLENEFIPALKSGNREEGKKILREKLGPFYRDQRQGVDLVVKLSEERYKQDQAQLDDNLRLSKDKIAANARAAWIILGATVAAVVLGCVTLGACIAKGITRTVMKSVEQVRHLSEQIHSATVQVAAASQSLAEGATEQAAGLEETSSSLEEMSSMTKQNADNAQGANTLATQARQAAGTGSESMSRMNAAILEIQKGSDETAKIVKVIDEIAFQTNLLALNAAVEAARAGEAGKGFAVVAEEVRNLAMRSAEAAKNTARMIEESVKNAQNGVDIANEVSKVFQEIVQSVGKTTDLVREIADASQEQAKGIDQVNTAVAQMDKVTQQNAANAEESASASEELSTQAESMNEVVMELAGLVGGASRHDRPEPAPSQAQQRELSRSDRAFHAIAEDQNHDEPEMLSAGSPRKKTLRLAEQPELKDFNT